MNESVASTVKAFIRQELLYDSGRRLDESTDLIQQGIIDSMSLLRLVSFLEERCHIIVQDEDLVAANFRSLGAIQAFVKRNLHGPPS